MSGSGLDARLTPARPDLAAASLRGRVEAKRFVEGRPAHVMSEVLDLRSQPRADAGLSTQLLHGEIVTVFDEDEGWAWVQSRRDGYVGYVSAEALGSAPTPDHRVVVARTFLYPAADMKRPVLGALPLDGRVAVAGTTDRFARLTGGGFVFAAHLAPLSIAHDFGTVAESLLGSPYLWGGKSVAGIDCSGLVHLSAGLAGHDLPRDTDMQEALTIWTDVGEGEPKRRGDLVFWRGHVGIMCDAEMLLHANAHHMLVVREPLVAAEARIRDAGSPISSVKRRAW